MMALQRLTRIGVSVCVGMCIPGVAFAQPDVVGGPLTGPPVLNAPVSADAITTVWQTLSDGTRIERTGTARYYRDRAGRVRVEQTIMGLDALNPAADGQVRITIQSDPSDRGVFTLEPVTRTANRHPRDIAGLTVGGGDTFALPLGGPRWRFLVFSRGDLLRGLGATSKDDSLGAGTIEGVQATGRRITMTIPVGVFGNDRPFEIVDERWESPALKMLIYARSSDPRTGVVEYRLTNIRRAEPPAELFVVPSDYTIMGTGDNGWTTLEYAERQGPPGRRRQ